MPVLGICYGMQLMTDLLGGEVAPAPHREFGLATIRIEPSAPLFATVPDELRVWASHGDFVAAAPPGFAVTATSANAPVAAMADPAQGLYALLFHPEVAHTDRGLDILRNFAYDVCGCTGDWTMASFVDEAIARIREQVGDGRVVCGLSGGVDSTVAAAAHPPRHRRSADVHLRRQRRDASRRGRADPTALRTSAAAARVRRRRQHCSSTVSPASPTPSRSGRSSARRSSTSSKQKAAELGTFDFLAQGTLYPDVIESVSVIGPSHVIKSHHNVGGLPERMRFKLVEPLRQLFKDEVRGVGQELGLDDEFVWRQPFPGPGLAVRILGEVTASRSTSSAAPTRSSSTK